MAFLNLILVLKTNKLKTKDFASYIIRKLPNELGLKKGNMIQHGVYHKNMQIFYRGKIVSTSYMSKIVVTVEWGSGGGGGGGGGRE